MPGSLNFCLIVRCTAIEIPVNVYEAHQRRGFLRRLRAAEKSTQTRR